MNALSTSSRWLLRVGSIGPLGHAPASGTVTVAVVGIPVYWLTRDMELILYLAAWCVFTLVAVRVHALGDRLLGEKDSRKLVWDELAGFWIAVWMVPFTWQLAAIAFLVERTIDITKVPPANVVEQRWPGGWGVVGDDVVAGLYTLALLHVAVRLFPHWVGL